MARTSGTLGPKRVITATAASGIYGLSEIHKERIAGNWVVGGVAGYFGGGWDGGNLSGIDKITFPADTKTTLSENLGSARYAVAGMANAGVAGYVGGGRSPTYRDGIDKIAFPADTKTTLSAVLATVNAYLAALSSESVAGYFGGGFDGSTNKSIIEKIAFPNDSKTSLSATLTTARREFGAMSNSL